ncbi:MAG: hypothetical protein ACM3JD_19580 [Rudaea sp.]
MKRSILVLLAVILFAAAATGCSLTRTQAAPLPAGPQPAGPTAAPADLTPAPAPATVAVADPTQAPAQSAADPISFNGITFTYSRALAQSVEPAAQPAADGGTEGPYWASAPGFVRFKFSGYVLPKTFHEPRIEVYPAADYGKVNPAAGKTIEALQNYLKTKKQGEQGMPFLPLFNAAQVTAAQVTDLNFKNGSGVRYITQFDQYPAPLNNFELFYTYQGITGDGKYYVAAILPVSNSLLPADDKTRPEGDYKEYLATATGKLDAASPSSYSPDLKALDALIESLSITSN